MKEIERGLRKVFSKEVWRQQEEEEARCKLKGAEGSCRKLKMEADNGRRKLQEVESGRTVHNSSSQ